LLLVVHFWAFLGKGSSKTRENFSYKKLHVANFPRKNRPKFGCQFFLGVVCFIAFSGVSQRWEFKSTTKNVLQKVVSKSFDQKIEKKKQTDLFLLIYHVFGRFFGEESKKTRKNILISFYQLGTIWPPRNQPTTSRPVTFFLKVPCSHQHCGSRKLEDTSDVHLAYSATK
jgi:hypothetical protein